MSLSRYACDVGRGKYADCCLIVAPVVAQAMRAIAKTQNEEDYNLESLNYKGSRS
jgi:hypothetical protein